MTIKKVGNLKVMAEQTELFSDITVRVYNGTDIISCDIYTGGNLVSAIDDILRKLDYYTLDYLFLESPSDFEKLTERTYKSGSDYFCKVDNTDYFKHLVEPAEGFSVDKNGMRIIDM